MAKQAKMFLGEDAKRAILNPADFIENNVARRMTIDEFVGDGDTVDLKAEGRLPVRFLGVDAAEKGFNQPLKPDDDYGK